MTTPTAVVVLGMHRSGTSVLARALMAVGVELGQDLQPAEPANPKGYFEDRSIVRLNGEVLETVRCRWDSLLIPNVPPDVLERFRARAVALIRERFGSTPLWGFKDPRVTRLQPFWHDVIAESGARPAYVLASRHPFEVASSLASRDAMPFGQALALWALHQAQGLEALGQHGGLVVDYDRMLQAPAAQLRRLANLLSQPADFGGADTLAFTDDFLERGLARAREGTDSTGGDGVLATLCRDMHRHLLMLSALEPDAMPAAADEGSRLCERVRRYVADEAVWLQAIDGVQAARREGEARLRTLESDVARLRADLDRVTSTSAYRAYASMKRWKRRVRRKLTGRA